MRVVLLVAAGASILAACASRSAPTARPGPTLVVLVTVDQMRGDYLTRYEHQFTGGLHRMIAGGTWYPNAFHDHANTETAPGHAAVGSGRFPSQAGIVSNARGAPDPGVQLLGSDGPGASPHRFRGTTFFDWVRERDPESRALSVSRKDRGAIMPIGRSRQSVYWFAPEGLFTTSTWYADTLPTWVQAFNARRLPERMAGRLWTPLLPDSAYAEPDSVPFEAAGGDFAFPHVMTTDSARAARSLLDWPWMDDVTLDLALAGVTALGLGRGPHMDVLAVSLSATDAVGHRFGPYSREIHDQVLRVDRLLGAFIDSLYRLRDSARIVIVLGADHGVAPIADLHAARTGTTAQHVSLRSPLQDTRRALADRGVPAAAFRLEGDQVWVDPDAFASADVPLDSVVDDFVRQVRTVPGVARVDRVRDLASADTARDMIARRWVHALPPDMPIEAVVTLEPYAVWGRALDAQHGSPWDYDTRVSILLYGAPFAVGRHDDTVRVVDLAPTLAAGVGIRPTAPVDGRVLAAALRGTGGGAR